MRLSWAVLLLLADSAAVHAECVAPSRGDGPALTMKLHLRVEAQSPTTRGPSSGISVTFLDTAPPEFARGRGLYIGTTDSSGRLDRHITFTWPDYFAEDHRPDSGTFDILVGQEVVHSVVECLPIDGEERQLVIRVVADQSIILE